MAYSGERERSVLYNSSCTEISLENGEGEPARMCLASENSGKQGLGPAWRDRMSPVDLLYGCELNTNLQAVIS